MCWVSWVCFTPVVFVGIKLSGLTSHSVELVIKIIEFRGSNSLMRLYPLVHYKIVVLRAVLEIWELQLSLVLNTKFLKLVLKLKETFVLRTFDKSKLFIENLILIVVENFDSIAIFVCLVVLQAQRLP